LRPDSAGFNSTIQFIAGVSNFVGDALDFMGEGVFGYVLPFVVDVLFDNTDVEKWKDEVREAGILYKNDFYKV